MKLRWIIVGLLALFVVMKIANSETITYSNYKPLPNDLTFKIDNGILNATYKSDYVYLTPSILTTTAQKVPLLDAGLNLDAITQIKDNGNYIKWSHSFAKPALLKEFNYDIKSKSACKISNTIDLTCGSLIISFGDLLQSGFITNLNKTNLIIKNLPSGNVYLDPVITIESNDTGINNVFYNDTLPVEYLTYASPPGLRPGLSSNFGVVAWSYITKADGTQASISAPSYIQFHFNMNWSYPYVNNFTFNFYGHITNAGNFSLQIWNYTSNSYVLRTMKTTDDANDKWYNITIFNGFQDFINNTAAPTNETDIIFFSNSSGGSVRLNYFNLTLDYGENVIALLESPNNNLNTTATSMNFRCSALDDQNINNITFTLWGATGIKTNTFRDLTDATVQNESFTVSPLTDDKYNWTCLFKDVANRQNNVIENHTLTIDTISPTIAFDDLKSVFSTSVVPINYTFVEKNPFNCWYSLDNGMTNTSFAGCGNNATLSLIGDKEIFIFINDSVGHQASSGGNFTALAYNFTYINNVSEASLQPFSFTSYGTSTIIDSVTFTYNGTQYAYDSISTNATAKVFNKNLTIPTLTGNLNYSAFTAFWNITLHRDTTYVNQTSGVFIQYAHRQWIGNCSSGYGSMKTLNFTFRDEITNALINVTGDAEITAWSGSKDLGRIYPLQYNHSEAVICIYPDWNQLYSDIRLIYSALDYPNREYNINNLLLTNTTNYLTLYLLNTTAGTEISVEIRDQSDNSMIGYVVEAWEYALGTGNYTMRDSKTSNQEGKVYFTLVVVNKQYQFRVKDPSGNQIWTSGDPFELKELTYLYRIPIGLLSPFNWIVGANGFLYTLNYSNNSGLVTYLWTNGSSMGHTCLNIYNRTAGNNYPIYTNCSALYTGTMYYTMNLNWDGYFIGIANATLRGTGKHASQFYEYTIGTVEIDLRKILQYGREGLLWATVIVGTLAGLGLAIGSPSISIVLSGIGLIAVAAMGLLHAGWALIAGMLAIGVFIMVRMSRG